ncbi:MAG TPA: hypothetical protein VGD68_04865 [Streptosporangiaceae bacterium]
MTRLAASRSRLCARMEEISFRTCVTVLTGVAAVAVVIAGTSPVAAGSRPPSRRRRPGLQARGPAWGPALGPSLIRVRRGSWPGRR